MKNDRALAQSLALIGQLGFSIACPMVAFIGGGAWLDGQMKTVPWFLFVGIFLGILTAGGALYQLSRLQTSTKKGAEGGTNRAEKPDDPDSTG